MRGPSHQDSTNRDKCVNCMFSKRRGVCICLAYLEDFVYPLRREDQSQMGGSHEEKRSGTLPSTFSKEIGLSICVG